MTPRQNTMQFAYSAYMDILNTIGRNPAESGGLLFGSREDYIVRKFVFDKNAETTRSTYSFDTKFLNPMIKKLWEEDGLALLGAIHSHPGVKNLSEPDKKYFSDLLSYIPVEKFLTPIVFSMADGPMKMFAHIFYKDTLMSEEASIEIIPDEKLPPLTKNEELKGEASYVHQEEQRETLSKEKGILAFQIKGNLDIDTFFKRTNQIIDMVTGLLLLVILITLLVFFTQLSNHL